MIQSENDYEKATPNRKSLYCELSVLVIVMGLTFLLSNQLSYSIKAW